ncbi:MAG TPA: menaquinone biosynthesis protein [Fimbriimonadaceae bacterium]|nr:menaquinone biosynthesis protein [Fimbriimonadaceae bacterium]
METPFTVGCVPFVNARPLVSWFESLGEGSPVRVIYELPSRLPRLLDEQVADAVLVSSYDALRTEGRTIADGVCIGSDGPAESVRLFSKVPFGSISSLAFDQSSLTSNALALGVLRETYGADPVAENCAPDLEAMLERHDACVLIGDIGMVAEAEGLEMIDLGQAWQDMIGLPFVWAAWVGRDDLSPRLVELLNEASDWGQQNIGQVVIEAAARSGWSQETTDRYLRKTMRYALDDPAKAGLNTFALLLERNKVLARAHRPRIVTPAIAG